MREFFDIIVADILGLAPGDALVVVADGLGRRGFGEIRRAMQSAEVDLDVLVVDRLHSVADTVDTYRLKLDAARGALIALPNSDGFHELYHQLQSATPHRVSVGTMPGFHTSVLQFVQYDLDEAENLCRFLQSAFWQGRFASLGCLGQNTASFDLGTLEEMPTANPGRIPRGTHRNIPGGVTFTVPHGAEGSIEVVGSIGAVIVTAERAIVIHLARGIVVGVEECGRPSTEFANLIGFPVGMIGVGVNTSVKQLIGHPLVDTKQYGSVSIGLGYNAHVGGNHGQGQTVLLTLKGCSLGVDGGTIMRNGVFSGSIMDWTNRTGDHLPDIDRRTTYTAPAGGWTERDGCLFRTMYDARGTKTNIPIASGRMCERGLDILTQLTVRPGRFDEVCVDATDQSFSDAFRLLLHFGLLGVDQ